MESSLSTTKAVSVSNSISVSNSNSISTRNRPQNLYPNQHQNQRRSTAVPSSSPSSSTSTRRPMFSSKSFLFRLSILITMLFLSWSSIATSMTSSSSSSSMTAGGVWAFGARDLYATTNTNIRARTTRTLSKTTTTTTTRHSRQQQQLPLMATVLGSESVQNKNQSSSSASQKSIPDNSNNKHPNKMILDPLIVCGPSGVGKGTIIDRFMKWQTEQQQTTKTTPNIQFGFSVSHTTRKPRPGEVNGVHYHFVSNEEMQQLIHQNDNQNDKDDDSQQTNNKSRGHFLEYAHVHGNYYGTSWKALKDVQQPPQNKPQQTTTANIPTKGLLDIDVQGVQRLKQVEREMREQPQQQQGQPNSDDFEFRPKYIFIAPPALATLEQRLRARGTETEEQIQKRLSKSKQEVDYGTTPGNFDAVIVNDDLDQAVREFTNVVTQQLYQGNRNQE